MGGGASRAKRRRDAKALEAGAQTGLSPAVIRRRKVLFGNAGLQPFERVSARNQFTDFPENKVAAVFCSCGTIFTDDSPVCRNCGLKRPFADSEQQSARREDEDLVFDRVGVSVANEFRTRALQICNADFLLGPHSIELLGLGIGTGSAISNRLFKIGQVGRHMTPSSMSGGGAELPELPPKEPIPPRPDALTCYELLALFSVIRAGTQDELLELLFCVFDADEDDKVSAKDFEAAIVSYLEMEGQTGLEGAELDAYRKVNPKDKTQAARRVAELAVSKYGSGVELAPDMFSEGEEVCDEHHGHGKDALAPGAKPKAQPRKSWLCLCAGKQPHDDKDGKDGKGGKDDKKKPLLDDEDSDGSGYSSDAGRKAKKKMQEASQKEKAAEAAPKKKSRFPSFSPRRSRQDDKKKDADSKDKLLGEKDMDEEDSGIQASKDTEGGTQEPESKETKNDTVAPKKKAAPKRTKAGCCPVCRGKAKRPTLSKQPAPPLSFTQWRTWFDDQFSDFALPDSKGAPPVMGQGEPKTMLPSGPPPTMPPGPYDQAPRPALTHGDTIMDMDANKSAGAGPPFGRSGSLKGNAGGATGIKQFRTTDDDEDSGADSDVPDSLRKMQQQALIG